MISIGRLEATAGADGDIGRSSTMDQSKELDLCFSELPWSSFLDSVQKKTLQKQNGSLLLNVFARKIYQRPAMGLNRHTSSDESGGNLGAELSYHTLPSDSSCESRNSDICSESFGFGPWPGADTFSVRKYSEVKIRFVYVTIFFLNII